LGLFFYLPLVFRRQRCRCVSSRASRGRRTPVGPVESLPRSPCRCALTTFTPCGFVLFTSTIFCLPSLRIMSHCPAIMTWDPLHRRRPLLLVLSLSPFNFTRHSRRFFSVPFDPHPRRGWRDGARPSAPSPPLRCWQVRHRLVDPPRRISYTYNKTHSHPYDPPSHSPGSV